MEPPTNTSALATGRATQVDAFFFAKGAALAAAARSKIELMRAL